MALFSVVHVISPVNDSSDCGESKSVRPPCSSALDSDSPFWFGSEDSGHVQRVLDQYCIWTQAMTTQERIAAGCCQADRASSRCPDRFVGRVVRRKKAFCKEDSCVDSNSDLVTIDEIRVYERVFVAVSDHFSPFVVYHGVTEWDADGLQTSMQFICPQRYEQYVARSKHTPSILYCRPEFDLDHFYAHSSEKNILELTHARSCEEIQRWIQPALTQVHLSQHWKVNVDGKEEPPCSPAVVLISATLSIHVFSGVTHDIGGCDDDEDDKARCEMELRNLADSLLRAPSSLWGDHFLFSNDCFPADERSNSSDEQNSDEPDDDDDDALADTEISTPICKSESLMRCRSA